MNNTNKKYLLGGVIALIVVIIGVSGIIDFDNIKGENDNRTENSLVINKEAEKLPSLAISFIDKTYPGYSVEKVSNDPLCAGGDAFDALLVKNGAPKKTLIFDDKGNYFQLEEEMTFVGLPPKVKAAVLSNFASYTPAENAEKLILANNTIQYQVDLAKDTTGIEAIFEENGTLVCKKFGTITKP